MPIRSPTSPTPSSRSRGIDGAGYVIAVDAFVVRRRRVGPTCSCRCTLWGEKTGTVTNLEGRVQRVGRKVAPEGTAMDDWRIAVELAFRLGADFDLATVDEVTDEIARVAPAHVGATAALLRRARDGVVLPLREHLRRDRAAHARARRSSSEDGHGTSWDPIKVEGEAPDEPAAADAEARRTSRRRPTPTTQPKTRTPTRPRWRSRSRTP